MKKYEYLIFDFDGVIADNLDLAIKGINEIGNRYNLPQVKNKEDIDSFFDTYLFESLKKYGISDEDIRKFYDEHTQYMLDNSSMFYSHPNAIRQIRDLNVKKGLITSTHLQTVRNTLGKEGFTLEDLFSISIGREVKKKKNQKIEDLLEVENIQNQNALYIGDMISDILYCREVPIDIACVNWGYNSEDKLKTFKPNIIINSISDLKRYI